MKPAQVVGAVGLAIVAGVITGIQIGKSTPPGDPCLTPGPHTIQVGANGSLSCPTAVVRWGDRITWQSPSSTRLTIRLQATNLGQAECPPTGSPTNVCTWTAPAAGTSTLTDYDVTVTGGSPDPAQTYGRIIIRK